jgi:multidrug efflux system outer membrane protein
MTLTKILTVPILLLFCGACKNLKESAVSTNYAVPAAFDKITDSTNSGAATWKTFYSDPLLTQLVDTALKNNQDLLMALQRINASRANTLLSRGALFPTVNGVLAAGQRRFGKYTMDGVGNYDTQFSPNISKDQIIPEHLPDYYAGFQASWEADIWGKLRNRKKAALARYLAQIENRNWVITNLVAEIASHYYELLALDNEAVILNETIVLQENALAIIELQKEAGEANELAVKQFEAQLLRSKSFLVENKQRIIEFETRINFLCGRFPQNIQRSAEPFGKIDLPIVRTGVPSQLLRNRPDIREAELELKAAKADVRAARAAFYPSITITGNIGYQAFNAALWLSTPQSLAYSIFANLAAPLLNRSSLQAGYQSSNAHQSEMIVNYRKTVLNGFTEVYVELSRISNLQEIYDLKEQETRVQTESIETSSDLFRSGRASYLEVLVSQQNALRTKLELVETRKQQLHASINVYKAIGGGWR